MFGTPVSSRAWAEVVSYDARFEFTDVIAFAEGGPDGSGWQGGPWAAEGRLHRPAFVAKRNGSLRRLSVLDPAVHGRYREAVARVAGAVERSLGPEVAGGRCLVTAPGLALEPWRRAWRRHSGRIRGFRQRRGPLVTLDVRDCFASIEPDVVASALSRCGASRGAASGLSDLLARFEADGIAGLPVGPEPSAVLANAVLAAADRSMRSGGFVFARWCDDVVVLSAGDPGAVHEAWAAALAPLGLGPAPEKARIVAPGAIVTASGPRSGGRRSEQPNPRAARALRASWCPHGARGAWTARELCERAVAAVEGPDPHAARVAVARAGLAGGRHARAALRGVRVRAPYLAATVEWGLRR